MAAADLSAVIPKSAADSEPTAESTVTKKRAPQVSRSADRRSSSDPVKAAELAAPTATSNGVARTEDATDDDPREIAKSLMPEFGFGPEQFSCLDQLYVSESDWRSEEHTSELQSLMRSSYAVFCLKTKKP